MKPANASEKNSVTTIAVPYYGRLARVGTGLERIFFLAEVDPVTAQIGRVSMEVWDPHGVSDLPKWLKEKEVSGVICSDINVKWRLSFVAEGVWILGGQEGEVAEVVQRWLAMERQSRLRVRHYSPRQFNQSCST